MLLKSSVYVMPKVFQHVLDKNFGKNSKKTRQFERTLAAKLKSAVQLNIILKVKSFENDFQGVKKFENNFLV